MATRYDLYTGLTWGTVEALAELCQSGHVVEGSRGTLLWFGGTRGTEVTGRTLIRLITLVGRPGRRVLPTVKPGKEEFNN